MHVNLDSLCPTERWKLVPKAFSTIPFFTHVRESRILFRTKLISSMSYFHQEEFLHSFVENCTIYQSEVIAQDCHTDFYKAQYSIMRLKAKRTNGLVFRKRNGSLFY